MRNILRDTADMLMIITLSVFFGFLIGYPLGIVFAVVVNALLAH
jgi:ABC-type methionine transport system permease subunit